MNLMKSKYDLIQFARSKFNSLKRSKNSVNSIDTESAQRSHDELCEHHCIIGIYHNQIVRLSWTGSIASFEGFNIGDKIEECFRLISLSLELVRISLLTMSCMCSIYDASLIINKVNKDLQQ